jgi:hypothetical protein
VFRPTFIVYLLASKLALVNYLFLFTSFLTEFDPDEMMENNRKKKSLIGI